jgi:uncharacterized protein YecE (DUF72 family)
MAPVAAPAPRTREAPESMIRIGTAGWTIPKPYAADFPVQGTHLQRYAQRFAAVEINSSFYRPHMPGTRARWAASVPPYFRFAIKIPRQITHASRLVATTEPLDRFLSEAQALGDRLGPLLVQLPPGLGFDPASAALFFEQLRARFDGLVVCEPRHASWFTGPVEMLLLRQRIARAAADPARVPLAAVPGGWPRVVYRRLHGSPRMYYSRYSPDYIDATAGLMRATSAHSRENWCIFDNTALGEATDDALAPKRRMDRVV